MLLKQIALLAALLGVGLLIVWNIDLEPSSSSKKVVTINQKANESLDSNGDEVPDSLDEWATQDIRGSSSDFGSVSSSSTLFGGSSSTATSTTATSTYATLVAEIEQSDNSEVQSDNSSSEPSLVEPTSVETTSLKNNQQPKSNGSQVNSEIKTKTEEVPRPKIFSDVVISGRVITDTGSPVPSMPLTLQLVTASEQDIERFGKQPLNATTDANGHYQFENLVVGDYNVCTALVPGFTQACQRPHAPQKSADFKLLVTEKMQLSGRVVDNQDVPVKEVSINAIPNQRARATTDDNGRYTLPIDANADTTYYLYFNKPEFARSRVRIDGKAIFAGETTLADTVLEKISGLTVRGHVRDTAGTLLQGQRVSLYSSTVKVSYSLTGTTDANGQFLVKNVKPAADYRVVVAPTSGYKFDKSKVGALDVYSSMPDVLLTVEITGKGSIGIRVVNSNQVPVANEELRIFNHTSLTGAAKTNENGYAFFEDVSATGGQGTIKIQNNNDPNYTFSGISLLAGDSKTNLEARVDRGEYSLDIMVKDQNDLPLNGIKASLTWEYQGEGVRSQTVRGSGKGSDDKGLIQFSNMGPGIHRLQLSGKSKGVQYKRFNEEIDINTIGQQFEAILEPM